VRQNPDEQYDQSNQPKPTTRHDREKIQEGLEACNDKLRRHAARGPSRMPPSSALASGRPACAGRNRTEQHRATSSRGSNS